jgi:hypothetical protein
MEAGADGGCSHEGLGQRRQAGSAPLFYKKCCTENVLQKMFYKKALERPAPAARGSADVTRLHYLLSSPAQRLAGRR